MVKCESYTLHPCTPSSFFYSIAVETEILPLIVYVFAVVVASLNRIPELAERAKKLKISCGFTPGAELGPLISKEV